MTTYYRGVRLRLRPPAGPMLNWNGILGTGGVQAVPGGHIFCNGSEEACLRLPAASPEWRLRGIRCLKKPFRMICESK